MCGRLATTREHTPPLCLFPEIKDTHGINFRKNLITVPSCDDHNSKKSKDDEFLMVLLAGIVGNNFLGFYHTQTKVSRALRRKSEDFLTKTVMRNARYHEVKATSGKKYYIISGNPDYQRLVKCFEHIVAGLYYNEFREVFKGKFKMFLGFINYNDDDTNTLVKYIKRGFELEKLAQEEKGDNPGIFKYQFCSPDEFGLIGLKMTFYQGAEIFVSLQPHNKEIPFNLGMFLMEKGIPTTFNVGDEKFEFNKEKLL